jgi:hypothetical protein
MASERIKPKESRFGLDSTRGNNTENQTEKDGEDNLKEKQGTFWEEVIQLIEDIVELLRNIAERILLPPPPSPSILPFISVRLYLCLSSTTAVHIFPPKNQRLGGLLRVFTP